MLTVGQARSEPIKIDVGQNVYALTFTANGKYLVTGCWDVQVLQVKDGKQVARMETHCDVLSVAASKNGKWIAAGTSEGMVVWNAQTYEQVLKYNKGGRLWGEDIRCVDFSPDSTRLIAGSEKKIAIVWDLGTGKHIQTLHHGDMVTAAKYSPQGDRIATATHSGPVGVWDSNDGRLLVNIGVNVTPWSNTGLLWSYGHLFIASDKTIKEFDASTGSKVSEWPIPYTNNYSCIALPKYEEFIAFSAKRTITLWDISTHSQLPLTVQHSENIRSIAFSHDDRVLAIGGGRKITLLPVSTVSLG